MWHNDISNSWEPCCIVQRQRGLQLLSSHELDQKGSSLSDNHRMRRPNLQNEHGHFVESFWKRLIFCFHQMNVLTKESHCSKHDRNEGRLGSKLFSFLPPIQIWRNTSPRRKEVVLDNLRCFTQQMQTLFICRVSLHRVGQKNDKCMKSIRLYQSWYILGKCSVQKRQNPCHHNEGWRTLSTCFQCSVFNSVASPLCHNVCGSLYTGQSVQSSCSGR
mmetsp:Transcript_8269/g.12789  ORF Transcript_8269/g.12789 Transcript_8269/m.12789 type:complete len:217 (+) Transcript_8269:256-906(+)